MVKFKIVDLGKDYNGKIVDFAKARNSFLETLPDDEYILYIDSDEEATQMLIKCVQHLPNTGVPYYRVRRINLCNGMYRESWNPEYQPRLVSNKVRWVGRIHEGVLPAKPFGRIDFPIIHNTKTEKAYPAVRWRWHFITLSTDSKLFVLYVGFKKTLQILREELKPPDEAGLERE